jgi:hypothetical protein
VHSCGAGFQQEARQMERKAEALRQEAAAQNLTRYTLDVSGAYTISGKWLTGDRYP